MRNFKYLSTFQNIFSSKFDNSEKAGTSAQDSSTHPTLASVHFLRSPTAAISLHSASSYFTPFRAVRADYSFPSYRTHPKMEHASAIPISIAIARVRSEALDIQRRVADQESLNASTAETHESWAREQVALDERHADAFLYAEDELMEANAKKTTQYEDALERNEGERRAVEGYEAQYSEMEAQVQALRLQLEAFPVQEGEALRDLQEGRDRLDSIVRCTLLF